MRRSGIIAPVEKRLQEIVDSLTDDERVRLALRDAIIESIRITVCGVDITRWQPRLPPELTREKPKQ